MNPPNPPAPRWFTGTYYDNRARYAMKKKIVDEARYFDVMMSDPKDYVRGIAVRRLTDQRLLSRAAAEDPDEDVRAEAVKKLTDQELLFRIAFRDPSGEVRLAAGEALRDNLLCFRTAMTHPDPGVRVSAVANMTDQQLLSRLLKESDQKEVCRKAADRITDPVIAEELFRTLPPDEESFATPRSLLVYHLKDPSVLADLAFNDPDFKVRRAAASLLTDQELLLRIVKDPDEFDRVRAAAAEQITDQEVLKTLADTYDHKLAPYDIGEAALRHISDQQFLKSVAEEHGLMHCLRKAAAEHVTDQEILLDWVLHGENDSLHGIGLAGIAVRRLNNPEYLAEAAVSLADDDLSGRAIERLHDDRCLLRVIRGLGEREDADNYWVTRLRCAAVMNMKDPAPLVELALKECNDDMDIVESFELECIRCIAESPSAMYDYASRFTNPDAWSWAFNFTLSRRGLEGFLENPLTGERDRALVLKRIGTLDRLGEIGMADE